MTAYQVLMHELAAHGVTTYKRLLAQYEAQGYSYEMFTQAVYKAKLAGLVTRENRHDAPIVAVPGATCPCCGHPLAH